MIIGIRYVCVYVFDKDICVYNRKYVYYFQRGYSYLHYIKGCNERFSLLIWNIEVVVYLFPCSFFICLFI